MRDEVQLAKIELKEEVGRAGRAGGLLGGAAFAGYMVVVTLSFALAWGLAEVMAVGWAFLIVGRGLGRRRRLPVSPRPTAAQRSEARAGTDRRDTQGGRAMGQESEELRADIEQRRESMSDTIDAIEDRVVPGRIIERKRQAAREWTGGLRDRVMGSAHSVGDQAGTRGGSSQRRSQPSGRQGVPGSRAAAARDRGLTAHRRRSCVRHRRPHRRPAPRDGVRAQSSAGRATPSRRGHRRARRTSDSRRSRPRRAPRATPRRSSRTLPPTMRTRSPSKRKTRGNSSRTTPRRAVNNE